MSDSRCGVAWAELESAWATISYPGQTGQGDAALRQLRALRRARARKAFALGCFGLAAAAALMVAFWSPKSAGFNSAIEPIAVAIRPDRQLLPDGSMIERNARTDVEVDYSSQERRVRLIRGEALFAVAHDPLRPFFVMAGGVEIRAVGTEFSVRYEPEQVDVLVTAGRVAVMKHATVEPVVANPSPPTSSPAIMAPVYVEAGRHLVLPGDLPLLVVPEIKLMAAEEISAALAWRGKRIEFTRTPLSQVAELFNRQNRLQLRIGDSATGALRITGLVWSDDPEGFVRLLESGFNVTAERSGDVVHLRQTL
jgi:transmembrane sensor